MDWQTAVLLGAAGGLIVELVSRSGDLITWQQDRRVAMAKGKPLAGLRAYIDPLPDVLVAFTRLGLGAVAGALLHTQVTGALAAVAVGAAAPALLRQIGTTKFVAARQAEGEQALAEPGPAPATPVQAEGTAL